MKNCVVALILIISGLCYHSSHAQMQVRLGIKGGVNINSLYWSNLPPGAHTNTKSFTSYHIGILAKIHISDKFSIIPELQYILKGFKTDDGRLELGYIDLPILANFAVGKRFSFEAGPEIGYRTSALQTAFGKTLNVTNEYNKVDAGLTTGLRFGLTESLSVIARYSISATPLSSIKYNGGSGNTYDISIHNQSVQFSLAYLMR